MRTSILCLLLACVSALLPAAASERYDGARRIVALSDVHGAHDAMVRTLERAGLLGPAEDWTGGDAHLVIVGDLLDRGPDSRKAMDLLMRLETEASAAGGRVHMLLGNHEAMNLIGDLRYVSKEEYAAFADDETDEERTHAFERYAARHAGEDSTVLRQRFDEQFPPGYFAHRRGFAADGRYGQWLLAKPIMVVINGTAFVHAGLSPKLAEYGLDGVNGVLREQLAEFVRLWGTLSDAGVFVPTDDFRAMRTLASSSLPPEQRSMVGRLAELDSADVNAPDGPLWYRGNVYCGELIEEDRVDTVLDVLGARRVVIGHTPTPDRAVLERLDGRVFEVDTGMLSNYYGGSGHALVLEGERVYVVSERSDEVLVPHAPPRRVGSRPDAAMSAEDLEQLLLRGTVGPVSADASGRDIAAVTLGDRSVTAIVAPRASRGNYPDVAAYRLDRLLELDMVPVAVLRDVDGRTVSLQFLPPGSVDEVQRAASGQGGSAYCPLSEQWEAMYVFDSLIYNAARTRNRMLYNPGPWQLLLIGHADAFGTRKGRPRQFEAIDLDVNRAWREALGQLDDGLLEERLGDVLDSRARRALLARRDELLSKKGTR